MNIWEELDIINLELKKEFLCVPPYQCVNGKFLYDLKHDIIHGITPAGKVKASVNLPWQRAYQIEYRYQKCDIFTPFMPVIEYATYDAMDGNWVCSYLSFLPVVEAVLREWAKKSPDLSFNKIKAFTGQLIDFLKQQGYYSDERKKWPETHIEFLEYILGVLYQDFDSYKQQNFAQIFNRNLSLHKLEGVMDISEGFSNKILPEHLAPRDQHEIAVGDILITRAGPRSRCGVCCLVKKTKRRLLNCDKVYQIKVNKDKILPEYMEYVLNSPRFLQEINHCKTGGNDSGVNLTQSRFLAIQIPVPPLIKQERIVQQIESRLSMCDSIEQTIDKSLQQAEALRQSVLKQAFKGRI